MKVWKSAATIIVVGTLFVMVVGGAAAAIIGGAVALFSVISNTALAVAIAGVGCFAIGLCLVLWIDDEGWLDK